MQRGRKREKALLSHRFQEAIDRAAMRAGKGSSDAYLTEWRRINTTLESELDLSEIAGQEAQRLESEFSDEQLSALVRQQWIPGRSLATSIF